MSKIKLAVVQDTEALLKISLLRAEHRKLGKLLRRPRVGSKSWHEQVRQCLLAVHKVYPVARLEAL